MTRKSGDFELDSPYPKIRQLPLRITDILDDKIQFSKNMKNSQNIPDTFIDWNSFEKYYKEHEEQQIRYFVKHKWGVKGRSVYPSRDFFQIKKHFREGQHIIQREVIPLLINERKFVIRSHVLVTCNPFEIFIHKNCIVLEHGLKYDSKDDRKEVHVSSAGKKLPTPYLLSTLPNLYEKTFPQMKKIALQSISCIQSSISSIGHIENLHLYHLFGYDFIIDKDERVVLLEINSYPALNNGTMSKVPKEIFEEILKDFINLVVLPITDKREKLLGGFISVEN